MRPGAWDPAGFLAPGDSLADVLARDSATLHRLGIEPSQLGGRLEDLLRAGAGSDALLPADVGECEVELRRQRGLITCPWAPEEHEACPIGSSGRPTANRFVLRHRRSGRTVEGFELVSHLIRAHGFFGGPGTRFRIDPEDLAAVLGLGPSRDRLTTP
jgi:hypothetical protein